MYEDVISRILERMWNCRGKHTASIDKVKMEQILRDELSSANLQPKTGYWVPVSEEFPKTEQYAFITVYNQTKMCWYQNGVFVDSKQNAYTKENEELIAWMPLRIPEPYKAESKEI